MDARPDPALRQPLPDRVPVAHPDHCEVEDPLTFQLESYSGTQPLERIRASWTPNDSSLTGGAWTDVKVPVPEASTLLLRGGWLLGLAALIVTRRRKAPGL